MNDQMCHMIHKRLVLCHRFARTGVIGNRDVAQADRAAGIRCGCMRGSACNVAGLHASTSGQLSTLVGVDLSRKSAFRVGDLGVSSQARHRQFYIIKALIIQHLRDHPQRKCWPSRLLANGHLRSECRYHVADVSNRGFQPPDPRVVFLVRRKTSPVAGMSA